MCEVLVLASRLFHLIDESVAGTTACADQADPSKLETDPSRPDQYHFDGSSATMTVHQEIDPVKEIENSQYKVREGRIWNCGYRVCLSNLAMEKFALETHSDCELYGETIQGDRQQEFIDQSLASAWQSCRRKYGDDPSAWQECVRAAVIQQHLGFYESLDRYPALDDAQAVSVPPLAVIDGGTVGCRSAQSYTQWVPMHDPDLCRVSYRSANPNGRVCRRG